MKQLPLILALPLWIVFFLSKYIPKDKNLIAFGTHTSSFSGNIKFLFFKDSDIKYKKIYISSDKRLIKNLNAQGFEVYNKLTLKAIWNSLRAGIYVYSGFPSDINFWLSGGAKYINVWHGTPIKKIERDVTTGKYSLKNRYEWLFKILKPYLLRKPNVLLVSSMYEEKCFKSAFDVKDEQIFRAFPPRLENLIEIAQSNREEKSILYVPTWRDDHSFSFSKYVNLHSFNTFLQKNKLKFNIKLHPSDKSMQTDSKYSNIILVDKNEDVYDYLKDTDILVSDYSSMVFEALYLSKPVILFCPDYETYQKNSREFYIDPCEDLPVEVSYTQEKLEEKLLCSFNKKVDKEKFKAFKPYEIKNDLLEKLVVQALHT